jgi:sugar phosphate permease
MGIASGIAIAGFGFSGVLVPAIVKLIDTYDWRQTAIILALGMIILILPLSLLFRHKPEQYGYFPDGQKQNITADLDDSSTSKVGEIDLRPQKAVKNATFWRLVLSRMYLLITMMAVITHVMPYLSSIGINRSTSSVVATAIPLTSVLGRLSFGWLGDQFSKKAVAATSFIMMSCGLFFFTYTSNVQTWLLVPFIVFLGIGYGGTNAIIPALAREHFGRVHFGSVYGLMEGIGAMGSIIGPIMAGWAYDNWGSYHTVWLLLACSAIVAIISVSTITPVKTIDMTDKKL